MQMFCHVRIVCNVAKVSRAIVMDDIAFMRSHFVYIRRLVVVTLLIPAPLHRSYAVARDLGDVFFYIGKIERRVAILRSGQLNLVSHERQRKRGEGQVRQGTLCGLRLRHTMVEIQHGSPVRQGIGHHGESASVLRFSQFGMQHPLRFSGLASDHGHRVRSGRSNDRVKELIEEGKAVGIVPEERNGIAVHMRHHQLSELLPLQRRKLGRLAIGEGDAFLGHGVEIVACHEIRIEVKLLRDADVAVVHRSDVGGIQRNRLSVDVLYGRRYAKSSNAPNRSINIDDRLGKAGCLVCWMRKEPLRSWVGAKVEVEGAILLEEDEDVFYLASYELQLCVLRDRRLAGGIDKIWLQLFSGGWSKFYFAHLRGCGDRAKQERKRKDLEEPRDRPGRNAHYHLLS